jgi:hypothetical protein
LALLWRFKVLFAWIFGVAGAVFVLGLAVFHVVSPKQNTSKVSFRLLFDGAEKSPDPNGMRFGPADVVTTPILESVYKTDGLDKYGSFDQFKTRLYVRPKNLKLEGLEEAFRAISDPRMPPVDRQLAEREFDAQRAAMGHRQF